MDFKFTKINLISCTFQTQLTEFTSYDISEQSLALKHDHSFIFETYLILNILQTRIYSSQELFSGIFLGLFGRGDKLKDYKYKGGHVDALTDKLGKSRVIINTSDYNRKPNN